MSKFFICEVQGVRFLTKLTPYNKSKPEIYGKVSKKVMPQTDAEIRILEILKEKIINANISPCILEMVYYKICNGISKLTPGREKCQNLMIGYRETDVEEDVEQLFCKYRDMIRNDFAFDKVAFLILEKCDMSFEEFLKTSINSPISVAVFKSLLFQIIYTFYRIQKIYPKFRHYDLHTNNVMLKFDSKYRFKATNPRFIIYNVDGEEYSIPYFGIIPKIIDFGFGTIPEEGIISDITEDRYAMYLRSENDLLSLFHWIYHNVAEVESGELKRIDKILLSLEPNRTYVHYYTEYIRQIHDILPTYEQMVKNKVFDEYKEYKVPHSQVYAMYG